MGLPEKFNRPETAPTKPEVLNWPTAKEIAIAQKSEPTKEVEWGLQDRFNRPDKAPTTDEVKNWNYPQYAQTNGPYP
jgi:hypothetical protein